MNRLTLCCFVLCSIYFVAVQNPAPAFSQEVKTPAVPHKVAPQRPKHSSMVKVKDDPDLPRALLIGDSISMGYTLEVRKLLAGKANVHRPSQNCGPTSRGLERIDEWLGDKPWDVIHFNFGLHDLKYVNEEGKFDKENGQHLVSPEQYWKNLSQIVYRLQETNAKLIWCSTTPVPNGAGGRVMGDAAKYNAIATRVMRIAQGEEKIVNDLYSFALPQLSDIQRRANVHFTNPGSKVLAKQVASIIEKNLPENIEKEPTQMASGRVFHDENANGKFDQGEKLLKGIRVSNGLEIVKTDSEGKYELPVTDDAILFVIKPRNWRTPIGPKMLPRFYYIHKPNGSPENYKYPGVSPTGPLPKSVDFALTPQDEPDKFKAIMFGDPQPSNQKEVDYVAHDVVEQLMGTDASFGVTLGDIMFDKLNLFDSQSQAIALLGIPWYNVIGNHDINREAKQDKLSDETFEREFGPSYYSFDYGTVHFIVLDNIEWLTDEEGRSTYQGGIGPRQADFVRRDLELIPEDQLVVLMMHVPITKMRDKGRLFRLIEQRPFCMSIAGHEHFHEHRFLREKDGWRGPEPHHHVINVTVCGSWWGGMKDERGIPHALMAKGAPNGYSVMTFDGHEYQLDFRAAGRAKDYQMNVYAPEQVKSNDETEVLVNVFNGSERSTVEMNLGSDDDWVKLKQVFVKDPAVDATFKRETLLRKGLESEVESPNRVFRRVSKARKSAHIWQGNLPKGLSEGAHCIRIRTVDMHGQTHFGYRIVRVVK